MHGLRNRELLERKDGNFSSLFLLRRTLDFDFLVCERRSLLRKGLIFLLDSLFHFFCGEAKLDGRWWWGSSRII